MRRGEMQKRSRFPFVAGRRIIMANVKELLRTEANGSISFGDYSLEAKTKLADFKFQDSVYKVKTFKEITRLEKNGGVVYESVPGSAVHDFWKTSWRSVSLKWDLFKTQLLASVMIVITPTSGASSIPFARIRTSGRRLVFRLQAFHFYQRFSS